jgi:DNA-binding IclR family transcriptional regulator
MSATSAIRTRVLGILREHPDSTASEIAFRAAMSRPAARAVLAELVAEGRVERRIATYRIRTLSERLKR